MTFNLIALKDFFMDPIYLRIIYLTLALFFVGWIIWYMYIKLSQRNIFHIRHPKDTNEEITKWDWFVYSLKYVFIFPLFTFLWFVLFVACLRVMSDKQDIQGIMILGIVLISAIRLAAYVHQKFAEDMAKLLPLTLLGGIILNPSFITFNAQLSDLSIFQYQLLSFAKYFLFIIVLELVLKLGHTIHRDIQNKRQANSKKAK
jgi:hypothetical protein